MAFRDTIKDYRRAATRRLEDARELMELPTLDSQRSDADQRHLRGAMYLAGYAVECPLKAYLIQQTNAPTLIKARAALNEQRQRQGAEPIENIARTAAGHQFYYPLNLTDLGSQPGYDSCLWGRLSQWQSAWRYESDAVNRVEAERFVNDVENAAKWIGGKIERE